MQTACGRSSHRRSSLQICLPETRTFRQVALQLVEAAKECDSDKSVRALIITGQGSKAFAAGADIKELASQTYSQVGISFAQGASPCQACTLTLEKLGRIFP